MRSLKRILCSMLCLAVLAVLSAGAATENENVQDPALAPSLPGLTVSRYDAKDIDVYILPVGPLIANQPGTVLKLEGKVTKILYDASMNKSTYEIYRHYEKMLLQNGFKILFSGSGAQLQNWSSVYYKDSFVLQGKEDMQRYICGRLSQPEGDTYVAVYSALGWNPYANTRVDIIEIPKDTGSGKTGDGVSVDRQQSAAPVKPVEIAVESGFEQKLKTRGKATAAGVTFKEGSDEIRSGSEAALKEIAGIIRRNPGMKCAVVCYTDSVGTPEYCRDLSARRAEKAMRYLMMYGADKAYLSARGAGWVPASSSDASSGETVCVNRVELVVEK